MTRNPVMMIFARIALAFDFLTPESRPSFALTVLKFAAAFAVGYMVQISEVLAPEIARGNEIMVALLVVLAIPMFAAVLRRLGDAGAPLILSALPLLLLGAASASTVMFGWPLGTQFLQWAALVAAVLLVGALCLPTKPRGEGSR